MTFVHTDPDASPLGKPVATYRDTYAPELLYPLSRTPKREEIGLTTTNADGRLPFMGADLWTAFELSWLTPRGRPEVALATFTVPCESPNIIESKSLKLYLNSFNMTRFESPDAVREVLVRDLSAAAGVRVGVRLVLPEAFDAQPIHELSGLCLDRMDIDCDVFQPAPELLTAAFDELPVTETLTSNLLKSNCLVTGQPDWGSVQISYSGPQIDQAGLLRYLVSFRGHNEFHEQCVERIYMDILTRCKPLKLQVYARYTRRGGLDINPWRTSHPAAAPANVRNARQ
ncbi:NADPH-dependent 7-cyano-7-deazaguanine reductase QueF [Sphaerotilus sp.]|uniref:NADPH-dependent 7-cyano-7-deazaguanine reductase QueF n=1 Tax=Sphaerotilus sp. TaxID=2093942 RepID=UPI002ACD4D9E|nr:NADPH-dependent 7-cyano-7-deazaguanine reductase QueF [Sphaerotilus sp.]MDZ7855687.1 NADPH-dependent 7-cyano-7-deazaguanine reductase QueF [Sphaerotilus sp.]